MADKAEMPQWLDERCDQCGFLLRLHVLDGWSHACPTYLDADARMEDGSAEWRGAVAMRERAGDIETARAFYTELLALERRLEAEGHVYRYRPRWPDAAGHLREARESLECFIGERMTADLVEAQRAAEEEQWRSEAERHYAPDGDE